MRCDDAIALFTEYRDGDLDPSTRAELEAHLAGCARCRAEYEAIDAARALLRDLRPEPTPSGLARGVRARLRLRPERPSAVLMRWALPAAAAVVLVVVAFGVLRVFERPREAARKAAPSSLQTPLGIRMPERPEEAAAVRRKAAEAKALIEEKARSGEAPPGGMSAPIGGATEHAPAPVTGRPLRRVAPAAPAHALVKVQPSGVALGEAAPPPAPPPPEAAFGGGRGAATKEATSATRTPSGALGQKAPQPQLSPAIASAPPAVTAAPPGPAGPPGPPGAPATAAAKPAKAAPLALPRRTEEERTRAAHERGSLMTIPEQPADRSRPGGAGRYAGISGQARTQSVMVSAQATRTQRAAGNLTLQLRTAQEVQDARVVVRPALPGSQETVVWQGTLNKAIANNLDIPVAASGGPAAKAVPQLVVVSAPQLNSKAYYVFAPTSVQAAPERKRSFADAGKSRRSDEGLIGTWEHTLQALASKKGIYVLAPGGFPMLAPAQVSLPTSEREVTQALGGLGYRVRQQEGVMTIEPLPARTEPPGRARRPRE
jgi:hypothetical protein